MANTAFATNTLTNQDEKAYRIAVTCGENTMKQLIKPRMKTTVFSGAKCSLKVFGVGATTITDNQASVVSEKSLSCKTAPKKSAK